MTTDEHHSAHPSSRQDQLALAPDELLAASHRRAASRARTSRTLDRSRVRRRVLPTVVVTSVALIGTGLANAFVGATVPAATAPTTTTVPAYVSRQNYLNAVTLAKLSATLAKDRRIVSSLTSTASQASATASSITASINASLAAAAAAVSRATATNVASGAPATTPASANSPTSTSSVGTSSTGTTRTTTPPAATSLAPPPVTTTTAAPVAVAPPVAAPPTQATTGASGAG